MPDWTTSKAPPRELSFSLEFPEKTSEVVCFALPVSYPVCLSLGLLAGTGRDNNVLYRPLAATGVCSVDFDKKNLTRSYSLAVADNDTSHGQQVQYKVTTFLPQMLTKRPKHTVSLGVEETHQFYASFSLTHIISSMLTMLSGVFPYVT